MDHRVLTIRRWLLLALALIACAFEPGLWFCVFAAPVMFFKTVGGRTGILISDSGKIVFGDPGQDCDDCCETADPLCDHCQDGTVHTQLSVVVAGLTEGTCPLSVCHLLNTTIIMTRVSNCRWEFNTGGVCNATPVNVTLAFDGATTNRKVTAKIATDAFFESVIGPDLIDCNFSSLSLPPIGTSLFCPHGSATCTITAI